MGARTAAKPRAMDWRQRVVRDGLLGIGVVCGCVLALSTLTFKASDASWNVSGGSDA